MGNLNATCKLFEASFRVNFNLHCSLWRCPAYTWFNTRLPVVVDSTGRLLATARRRCQCCLCHCKTD
jgi:hypothetical protein